MDLSQTFLTSTSVSSYEIINDPEIVNYLYQNGWTIKPKNTAQGMMFYNATSNAAIILSPEATTCTRLAVISLAHPDNSVLKGPHTCSAIGAARIFFREACEQYAGYDPFTMQNNTNYLDQQ